MKIKSIIPIEGQFEIECIPPGVSVSIFDDIKLKNNQETSMPDIDYDISRCDDVKKKLIEDWGENNVVYISNWNTLQLSSLIKDVSKFYEIPFGQVNEVTNKMLFEAVPKIKEEMGIKAGVLPSPPTFEQVLKYSKTLQEFVEEYPQISNHINNLYRQIRSCFSNRSMILTNHGPKTPEQLLTNDMVAFINNKGKLDFSIDYSLIYKGKKEIYSLLTEDGYEIELTKDHLVLTSDGYKEVQELTENDQIIVVE